MDGGIEGGIRCLLRERKAFQVGLSGNRVGLILQGPRGELEPIPADIGREVWYVLDSSPAYPGVNVQRQTTIHTDILESPISLTPVCMSLDCGRKQENTEKPTLTQGEHANSTQKDP
ncbi:unnamed protein product [Pleuronectes platessa]|uniref:Uncharacterized protein n=1 Tax=Pleuronectes platessa TaxID=8262 RepID=A0A9N7V7F8_PLEPL|nr:unnamed protein product [Pleuronectes platessa]